MKTKDNQVPTKFAAATRFDPPLLGAVPFRGVAETELDQLKSRLLARELERRVAPLGLTVEDAVERLHGVRLVCLGDAGLGLWRLADSYPAAQTEVLGVLPKLGAPVLSLGKANQRRLRSPRQGRPGQ